MENRVKEVLSVILELDVESIDNTTSSETVSEWDSLNHINIIVALEEEFDLKFDDIQIPNLKGYESIVKSIQELEGV